MSQPYPRKSARLEAEYDNQRPAISTEPEEITAPFAQPALKWPGAASLNAVARGSLAVQAHSGVVSRKAAFTQLQNTLGNRYAGQVARSIQQSGRGPVKPGTIQRGSDDSDAGGVDAGGRKPATPSIAAQLTTGSRFGGHASVFVTDPDNENKSKMIDLRAKAIVDKDTNKKVIKITINKKEMGDIWARKGESTTWAITAEKARKALTAADDFIAIQDELSYNLYGIGYKSYNCALLAEKILKAAGINRSAGLIFSTPSELVTGSMGGDKKFAAKGKSKGSSG